MINSILFLLYWVKYKCITSCFKKKIFFKTYLGSVCKLELKVTSGLPSGALVVLLCRVFREEGGTLGGGSSASGEPSEGRHPQDPPSAFPVLPFWSAPLDFVCSLCSQGSEIMSCARDDFESKSSSWGLSCLTRVRWNFARHALPRCSCSRPQIGLFAILSAVDLYRHLPLLLQHNYR